MKLRNLSLLLLCGAMLALNISPARAAYWTGAAADNNFWNAGNWSGTPPAAFGTTTESLFMTNAPGVTGSTVNSDLNLADGVAITVVNSTLDLTSSTNALVAKALGGNSNNPVQLNVIQFINSTVTLQAVQAMSVSLLSNSALNIRGTGRSINSSQEPTSVTMSPGSSITFTAGTTDPDGAGTPATPRRSGGLSIFNGSSLQSYAADALSSPLTDFSVTGSDLTPFGPLGGGDGVNGGAFTITALQTAVFVNSTESWDGVSNPHAADGVTLTGTGALGDPAIYTIPKGLTITSTGKVNLWSEANKGKYINFVIQGGNLQIDAGGVLNPELYTLRTGIATFVLDLSGTNSITGAGKIGERNSNDSIFRTLTIQNVKNISLADIFMQVVNGNRGPTDFAFINITASGSVLLTGTVDNSDRDGGGDGNGDITIQANTIDVNNIDARGFRDDPSGRDAYSGNVTLRALSPVGNYDPADAVNNAYTNKLTVRGSILTFAVDPETIGGNVTLQSVVQQLVFGTFTVPQFATTSLRVGKVQGGASAADLYVNVSGSGPTPAYDVDWAGTYAAPAGNAPVFTADPTIRADATNAVAYSQMLAGTATDADSDPLAFAKGSGPAWLTVAADGTLSGTPGLGNQGTNTWIVSVTDGTRFDTTTLQIFVVTGPRWLTGTFREPNAEQLVPYSQTVATNVSLDFGAGLPTYTKISGPAWLSVAANGAITGTPAVSNVLDNTFTVSVSDGVLPPLTNTFRVFVNGSPIFNTGVGTNITKAKANVSDGNYSVKNQTLAGSAVDPQDPTNPNTLSWAKVSGPAWLVVDPSGALSGTPSAGDIGANTWIITAANTYPAATAKLTIVVQASPGSGPVEVTSREYWDGVANPHAADGVTLTGTGTAGDPATYTVPRGLLVYAAGQIYTSLNSGQDSEAGGSALNIKFNIQGDLTLDGNNNAFVIAVHARTDPAGRKHFILDLNGTNNILGAGRIVGLGNRVDALVFPDCFDRDAPRIVTITNVNNVSLYDINVQVRNVSFNGRPLEIRANGKVQVTSGIDNSNRDTGGDDGQDITVLASQIDVTTVDTRASRNPSRKSGNIRLNALNPPYATGGNNAFTNTLTIRGGMRADAAANNPIQGTISLEGVVVNLQTNAAILTTNTVTLNVGKIQGGATAGQLFVNQATDPGTAARTANYVVDWFALTLTFGPASPGQIQLIWGGTGYTLQTNSNVANPAGWGTVPGATSPAIFSSGSGNLYFRLKQ